MPALRSAAVIDFIIIAHRNNIHFFKIRFYTIFDWIIAYSSKCEDPL